MISSSHARHGPVSDGWRIVSTMSGIAGPPTLFSQDALDEARVSVGERAGETRLVGVAVGDANVETSHWYASPLPWCSHAPQPTPPSDGNDATVPAVVSQTQSVLEPPLTLKVR